MEWYIQSSAVWCPHPDQHSQTIAFLSLYSRTYGTMHAFFLFFPAEFRRRRQQRLDSWRHNPRLAQPSASPSRVDPCRAQRQRVPRGLHPGASRPGQLLRGQSLGKEQVRVERDEQGFHLLHAGKG